MIRALLAALALAAPALAAPAPRRAAAATDWRQTVVATPQGGFRMGNPDAPVKLVEYGSLTCPHCRDFQAEAAAAIRNSYVAGGRVSFEFRPFILNAADFTATTLVRCTDPRAAMNRIDIFYARQEEWALPFFSMSDEEQARVAAAPDARRVLALGRAAGLDRFVGTRGIPPARFAQCLTDRPAIDRVQALQEAAVRAGITSTPTFFINGARENGAPTWDALETRLKAVLR